MAQNTDKQGISSKREAMLARMKNKYPDKDFADDEALYGQIDEDFANFENEVSGYKEREKAIGDLFSSDPRSARFLMEWKDGGDPLLSVVKMIGTDGLKAVLEDEERAKELADANSEYLERIAKQKELEDEYQANLQQSLATIEQMQAEKGLTDEQVDKAMEMLFGIVRDGIVGKFSTESIQLALKASGYDEAVANAAYEGEVKGRNAKISEKLQKENKGDGLAALGGKNASTSQVRKPMNIFDYADAASR